MGSEPKRGEIVVKYRLIAALAAGAAVTLVPATAQAQRQAPPTPEQRLDRLEKQIQQVQRQVFPKGRPADTAGFSDDPAATQSSVVTLDQRLDAVEKQMADLVRQSEENGNRLRTIETNVGQIKTDQDQRISALEQKMSEAAAAAAPAPVVETPSASPPAATKTKPGATKPPPKTAAANPVAPALSDAPPAGPVVDAGEEAY